MTWEQGTGAFEQLLNFLPGMVIPVLCVLALGTVAKYDNISLHI